MLEQLFGSRTRVALLRLFLDYPFKSFYVRELARLLDTQLHSIRRELENLESFGLLRVISVSLDGKEDVQKKYYALNTDFILYHELRTLFVKARLLVERDLIRRLQEIGRIHYCALTGFFVGLTEWPTDLFIVGQVNRGKMRALMRRFEKELRQDINYTVMSKKEFKYRRDITDRFVFTILENKKIVVIDKFLHTTR